MRTSHAVGRYFTAETDITMGPVHAWASPTTYPGVIWSGGLGQTPDDMVSYDAVSPQFGRIVRGVGDAFPLIASDLGGIGTWANNTAIARTADAKTFMQGATSPVRAASGEVLLLGMSMGFADLMAYARANLSSVAAAVGVVGLADLNALYTANRGGFAAGIDTAYGGTYSTVTHGPTHSPRAFASQLTFPILLYYAASDATILPAESQAFAAAAPDCTLVSMTGGHTTFTQPASMVADIIAFFQENV